MSEARLELKVHARARSNRLTLTETGVVAVRVAAVPERGRANTAVVELLARALGVATSAVEVLRGHTSRDKVVLVRGLSQEEALERLREG